MAEYIEREALLEKRWDVPLETEDAHFVQVVDVGDILSAPAADVAPVRHGYWTEKAVFNEAGEWTEYECSCCRKLSFWGGNFCNNCGAKMDGGGDG